MPDAKRYPPVILGTAVVPWDDQFQFMEDLFRRQVRLLRSSLTNHLYVFGTAGEGYAVSDRQFDAVVRAFLDEMQGDAHPMVGLISLSLPTIIERIERCRSWGMRAFQISLPSWGACTDREVDVFFEETCGRFPDCRFLNYNLGRTKKLLGGDDYARLSARHPNLVAVKVAAGDKAYRLDLLTKAPQLQFFVSEHGYIECRDEHECGLLISLAATNAAAAKAFLASRGPELAAARDDMDRIVQAMTESVPSETHMDGAYDKMLIKLHMPEFPLRLLPPYQGATEAQFARFAQLLPPKWRPGA